MKTALKLKGLSELNLMRTLISDEAFLDVGQAVELRQLGLDDTEIGDAAVMSIFTHLPQVTHLSLGGTRVTDGGLARAANAQSVES